MRKFTSGFAALVLLIWLLPQNVLASQTLIPVGQTIGLELGSSCVTVAAFDEQLGSTARQAGLRPGDRIVSIDGKQINQAEDVRNALKCSNGTVKLCVERSGSRHSFTLAPQITDSGPKLGVYLKQGITGVGTVTWYDPASGTFGALGHGVNDASGRLVRMQQGNAYCAEVVSVKKGVGGTPGQLLGSMNSAQPIGKLYKNSPQGIFGIAEREFSGEAMEVGQSGDIRTGPAQILTTISGEQPQQYCVEILKIYPGSGSDGRNLLLRVTDPALLDATGGIVQGMSGSPIIQNGKLVGAVTHVLVNDPTTGYGIFIENMLDAAA